MCDRNLMSVRGINEANSRLPDRTDDAWRPSFIGCNVRRELVLQPLDGLKDTLVLAFCAALAFLTNEAEGRRVRRVSRGGAELDTGNSAILGQLLEERLEAGVGSLELFQTLRDLTSPQLSAGVRRVGSRRPRPRGVGSGDEVTARSGTSAATASVDVSGGSWSCAMATHGGSLAPIHFILRERHRAAALSVSSQAPLINGDSIRTAGL